MSKWISLSQKWEVGPSLILVAFALAPAVTGLFFKYAQYENQYPASPSASLALSHLLQLIAYFGLFYLESRGLLDGHHRVLPTESGQLAPEPESAEGSETELREKRNRGFATDLRGISILLRNDDVWNGRYELGYLALLQLVTNNSAFTSYQVADAGTVQLFKYSVPFIVGGIAATISRSGSSGALPLGALILVLGLIATQLSPESNTMYPPMAYFMVILHAVLGEITVQNERALSLGPGSSSRARKILLTAVGAVFNLFLHIGLRVVKTDEPGFFDGYWLPGAVIIIFGNALVGAVTSLSHYVDMPLRHLTTIPAVVFLLYYSSSVFGAHFGWLIAPGTILSFAGSWLYVVKSPRDSRDRATTLSFHSWVPDFVKTKSLLACLLSFVIAIVTLVWLNFTGPRFSVPTPPNPHSVEMCVPPPTSLIPPFEISGYPLESLGPSLNVSELNEEPLITSPFKSTVAMIRWNDRRLERVPLLMKYGPFFHTIHISMPNIMPEQSSTFHNLTHDQYPDGERAYIQLARTMELLLDEQPDVTGVLYFHFDAWIDPLAWEGSNPNTIWILSTENTRLTGNGGGGPRFTCMTDPRDYPGWWGWQRGWHKKALRAIKALKELKLGYTARDDEWCVAWADIYYIPRRFFADYILLSHLFGCEDVFHEVAIPTMLHIIDQSRRANPFRSVIDRMGECWGGCCDSSATAEDVLWTRCGHRLNYLDQAVVEAHYGRLEKEAAALGRPMHGGG